MNRSLVWILALSVAPLTAACSTQPTTINISDDDDGGGGSSGATGTTGSGTTTGGGTDAHSMFVDTVYPSIAPTCGSCHAQTGTGAPTWMTANAEGSYTAITGFTPSMIAVPDNSTLVQHGAHTGPALTPAQVGIVSDWLLKEVEERGLVGGDPTEPAGLTLAEALEEFANCMSIDDWNATGMDNLPMAQTGNAGPCSSCHNAGDGGTWLSLNVDETFAKNREFPYIKRLVTGTVAADGSFDDLAAARRFIEKGQEPCGENQNCHPSYSMPPGMVTAVETFVQLTLDRWHADQCPTPI